MTQNYDAIVIGGGPAGSTAGAVLAMHGRKVAVLEREKFPRYHIGESLLPYCYFTLERLGVIDRMNDGGFTVKKYSVQFVSEDGRASNPFYFFQHVKHECAVTWQVVRSEFDQMLLNNAGAKGAEVFEQTAAKELIKDPGGAVVGVNALGRDGQIKEFRAPMTIDASGRDSFAHQREGWRVFDPSLKKMAIWTYYKGAKRDGGYDEGATTVAYVPEKGWFWYIPQTHDVISVGVVAEKEYLYRDGKLDPGAIFQREVKKNKWIEEHLAAGEQVGEYRVTAEYSYRSKYCAADGLVLAGDAFAFLDPVFSSGVFLALRSGELAADAVHEALTQGDYSAKQFEAYGDYLRQGIESMRNLVYAFYDQNFAFGALIRKYPQFRGDVTDCLIGDLFHDMTPLFTAVSDFATVPTPLPHGRPLLREPIAAT